jgi:vacuolar protein sorting-associated protein 3
MTDENFPGFEYVIDMLSKLKEHNLVWKYVDWALTKDQKKGVEIFTKRSSDELVSERMRAEVILENIQIYRDALAYYLEFLIYTKNVKVENVAFFGIKLKSPQEKKQKSSRNNKKFI